MKKIIVLLLLAVLLAGCSASTGFFAAVNSTQIDLSKANYEIVAKGLQGTAKASYLLGVFRMSKTGLLYQEAISNLWEKFEEKHGSTEGRYLAIVNVVQDSEASWGLLTTTKTVSIRADVVEFRRTNP